MQRMLYPSLFATTLLTACAGDSLLPTQSEQFQVSSKPAGATVYIMGKEVGKTPLDVATNQLFPISYPKELESKFGKIELKYPGCEPYIKPVSGRILADGLKAKLDCASQASPVTATRTPHERLRQLKSIYDEGLISKEEYQEKRQSILNEL